MSPTYFRTDNLWALAQGGFRRGSDGTLAELISGLPSTASISVSVDARKATVSGPTLTGGTYSWNTADGSPAERGSSSTTISFPGSGARNIGVTISDLTGASRTIGAKAVIQTREWQAHGSTVHGRAGGIKSQWTPVESGVPTGEWEQLSGDPYPADAAKPITETAGQKVTFSGTFTWPAGTSGRRVVRVRAKITYPWGTWYGEPVGLVSCAGTQPTADDGVKVPFKAGSWPYHDVRSAPLATEADYTGAPTQAALVKDLVDQIQISWYPMKVPALNAFGFASSLIIARPGCPKYNVEAFINPHADQTSGPSYYLNVPIPDHAVASAGTDGHIAIYEPETDKLWEFWQFHWKDASTPRAAWGGRIDNVSQSEAQYTPPFGVSASGLAFPATAVTIEEGKAAVAEAAAGRSTRDVIQHAVYFCTIYNKGAFVWPANRKDGGGHPTNGLYHGQRFRFPASIDFDALPNLHPLARAIGWAGQKYGFIMMDTAGQTNVGAQSGMPIALRDGTNPWTTIEGSKRDWDILVGLPWTQVEILKAGWKPSTTTTTTQPVADTTNLTMSYKDASPMVPAEVLPVYNPPTVTANSTTTTYPDRSPAT